tara:strand:- start:28325 stop:29359 length:1035 start_codon:yes stop_codon:yes gene_type:complete
MLKVGIAGYGVVGKRRRLCVENNPNLKLIAICDQNFKKDSISEDGIFQFSDYKNLLNKKLDIIIICLTNNISPQVVIESLKKDLHVFCEKPPGRNLNDILNVIEQEKKNKKLKLMYGFNHRFHDSVKEALKITRKKKLGNIINIRGIYGKSQLITFNQTDWRTKRDIAGGGVLLDQGIHMVDLMRLFAGNFCEIKSFISNNHWGFDVEDNAYALLKTKDGIVGMLNSSATQWRHKFNLEINLEKGSLILEGILSSSKSYGAETLTIVYADPTKDNGDPLEVTTNYNKDNSWEEEIDMFVSCILKDKNVQNGSSKDAFETMKHVYKIYFADLNWREKYKIDNPNI